ncbi:DUF4186 domain-containing protein [Herbaspirillum rhizosphaerae]|uniref:DUF4186 domain-containing protein n=1 Tax=Herbaspirillum rhizosphaerae TaxID=346179 RepID=UPI00067E5D93|nr:DUF4186 domain-containing protein [Herbaspirillum rhizosphaerae]
MYSPDLIFDRLRHSQFRVGFTLKPTEYRYLQEHGLETVLQHAEGFIATRLTPAFPVNDGKQTPFRGHPVFVAQHATATCCRSCLEKWHGIGKGEALTTLEQQHVLDVLARWLDGQPPPAEASSNTIYDRDGGREPARQGVLF